MALIAEALSYLVSVVTLLAIRTPEPIVADGQPRHLGREIGEGLATVTSNPVLRALAFMSGFWNGLDMIAYTLFLLYAIRERGLSPGLLGAVIAAGACGGLLGAAVASALARRTRIGLLLSIAFCAGCLPWIALPMIAGSQWIECLAFAAIFFSIHVGLGIWAVVTVSLRQTITPGRLLGRTNASLRLISYGLGAVGALAAGFLGTWLGLRPSLWLAASGFLVLLVCTLCCTPLPRLRSIAQAS